MTESESRPLHSIALEASAGLKVTRQGIVLDPKIEAKLRDQLVLSFGSTELEWAVRSLLLLAARLEKRNGKEAAASLIKVACSATRPLSQQASQSSERARRVVAQRTSQFLGMRTAKPTLVPNGQKPNRLVVNSLMKMPRRA